MQSSKPDLIRYWLEFDMTECWPPGPGRRPSMNASLLVRGIGVTGYDLDDCLALVRQETGEELPPLTRADRDPRIDEDLPEGVRVGGVVVWRGIWWPPRNITGPTID